MCNLPLDAIELYRLAEITKKLKLKCHISIENDHLYLASNLIDGLPQEEARTKPVNCVKDVKPF